MASQNVCRSGVEELSNRKEGKEKGKREGELHQESIQVEMREAFEIVSFTK